VITGAPVAVAGPPGSGKSRFLRQALSSHGDGPLVVASGDGDPATLLRGLREAHAGTLLIEGAHRLSPEAQDVIHRTAIKGGAQLAATLSSPGSDGWPRLRPDLAWTLRAHLVEVPPLAERPEDAVWMLRRLFGPLNARRAEPLEGIGALTEDAVRAQPWGGEGRELRARLRAGVETASGPFLMPADLFSEGTVLPTLVEAREAAERAAIVAALGAADGHPAAAARRLAISRTTLWERMQRFGLTSG
jgi:hypothetical protein